MKPYLYTNEEIDRLMNAALEMPNASILTRQHILLFLWTPDCVWNATG